MKNPFHFKKPNSTLYIDRTPEIITIFTIILLTSLYIYFNHLTFTIPPNTLGYDTTSNQIYEPGTYHKFHLTDPIIKNPAYHVIDIPIHLQTTDNLQLIYHYHLYHYKWHPQTYLNTYQANETLFVQTQINLITPYLTIYMSNITERDFELNILTHQKALDTLTTHHINLTGLIQNPQITYPNDGYFQHLTNPTYNYIPCPECTAYQSTYNLP